jgi:hypothetical protein
VCKYFSGAAAVTAAASLSPPLSCSVTQAPSAAMSSRPSTPPACMPTEPLCDVPVADAVEEPAAVPTVVPVEPCVSDDAQTHASCHVWADGDASDSSMPPTVSLPSPASPAPVPAPVPPVLPTKKEMEELSVLPAGAPFLTNALCSAPSMTNFYQAMIKVPRRNYAATCRANNHADLCAELEKFDPVDRKRIYECAEVRRNAAINIGQKMRQCKSCINWFLVWPSTQYNDDGEQPLCSEESFVACAHDGFLNEVFAYGAVLATRDASSFTRWSQAARSTNCHYASHGTIEHSCTCKCKSQEEGVCFCCMPTGCSENTQCSDNCALCKDFVCTTCQTPLYATGEDATDGHEKTAASEYEKHVRKVAEKSYYGYGGRYIAHYHGETAVEALHDRRIKTLYRRAREAREQAHEAQMRRVKAERDLEQAREAEMRRKREERMANWVKNEEMAAKEEIIRQSLAADERHASYDAKRFCWRE